MDVEESSGVGNEVSNVALEAEVPNDDMAPKAHEMNDTIDGDAGGVDLEDNEADCVDEDNLDEDGDCRNADKVNWTQEEVTKPSTIFLFSMLLVILEYTFYLHKNLKSELDICYA